MTNKPVRPKFEQEYLARKAAEQPRQVNGKVVENNIQNEKEEPEIESGGKSMNTLLKILLSLGAVAGVGLITMGIMTYQTTKNNNVQEAASVVQIQATDNTAKSNVEKEVDMTLQYQDEASDLWGTYNELLICSKNEFINKYVQYRKNGLAIQQAVDSIINEFGKENQIEVNEENEAVAEPTEMDTLINSEDENIDEETVENDLEQVEETSYEIESIEPTKLYAIQQVNVRKGPSADDFDKVGSLAYGEQVEVIGVVKEYKGETVLWYQLNTGEFVSGAYLLEQLPVTQHENDSNNNNSSNSNTSTPGSTNNGNTSNPDVNAKLDELMKSGEYNFNLEFTGQATVGDGSGNFSGVNLQ